MKHIISLLLATLFSLSAMGQNYVSQRPIEVNRLFHSQIVENEIDRVSSLLTNPKLIWMFTNCFPNTLDTTVHFDEDGNDGLGNTYIYTGDIHAMWLRDSGAQVWHYVQLASRDEHLKKMIRGLIIRQFKCIILDPYANAFYKEPLASEWQKDKTNIKMDNRVHERKWEIDSHCYPIRLAYQYWKSTGDTSIFGESWISSINTTLKTFREQQRKKDKKGSYFFLRRTERQLDTKCCNGYGNPVKPIGLIASSFRPSDDATTFEFLIPSNFFAVKSLRQAATILETVNGEMVLAKECIDLADEVEDALKKYAVVKHPEYGKIYAFEVDGFGNALLMDDSNVPSLLSLTYLEAVSNNDKIYNNTRKFVLSDSNPYYFKGSAAEGIGGPHIGYDMIWPMSIMMRAFTSNDDNEIRDCIKTLMDTDANTGFIHESFHKDDPNVYTRAWFAWQNSLFGELILKLVNEGKLDLLNNL